MGSLKPTELLMFTTVAIDGTVVAPSPCCCCAVRSCWEPRRKPRSKSRFIPRFKSRLSWRRQNPDRRSGLRQIKALYRGRAGLPSDGALCTRASRAGRNGCARAWQTQGDGMTAGAACGGRSATERSPVCKLAEEAWRDRRRRAIWHAAR